jgi:hypothetical protein
MNIRQHSLSANGAQEQMPNYYYQRPPSYWHQSYSENSDLSSQLLKPSMAYYDGDSSHRSGWNPRSWGRGRWCACGLLIVVVVVAAVVGAVLGVRTTRYPDYSKLAYSLQDTYQGESFFDNFDYFTGWGKFEAFLRPHA